MKSLHSHYGQLTGQEHFSLIVTAGARNDQVEQDWLRQAGSKLYFTMPDHAPWAEAFETMAQFAYMELVEEASRVFDEAGEAWEQAPIEREVVEPGERLPQSRSHRLRANCVSSNSSSWITSSRPVAG